jgi:RNA polymerase sigma-70 factor (ECF subfamily)
MAERKRTGWSECGILDVWSQAERFEGRSQVSTWILSIARFKALSALSALRRNRDAELDDAAMELIEDSADTPEQVVLNQDRSAQLRTCLAQMSREHREIIDLVYYHEKSVEEVVEIIQMPKNTVKTRMLYARKRIAQLLSTHRDFDHNAYMIRLVVDLGIEFRERSEARVGSWLNSLEDRPVRWTTDLTPTSARPLARRFSEKEADHLAAGVWPACVGVGSGRAAAGPCVTEAMNHPLLQNLVAASVGVHSAAAARAP